MHSVFTPIPKKVDQGQCQNYRTIGLVSHANMIMLWIILERIRNKTESKITDEEEEHVIISRGLRIITCILQTTVRDFGVTLNSALTDLFAAHFQLNSLLILPTGAS